MGNKHPTQELIRSITEYVNARYESSERVVSYQVDSAQALFALDGGSSFGVPGAVSYSAPPSPGAYSAPSPEASAEASAEPPETAPLKSKRSVLKRIIQGKAGVRNEAKPSYSREGSCDRAAFYADEAVAELGEQPSFSISAMRSLEDLIKEPGESFAAMLFRLIDEKGLTDPDVYNKAGVSRQTFSKIRSKEDYAPSKDTVIALAMALGLTLDEAQDFLNTAGFALSNSSRSDIVISYFFEHDIHDLDLLNETLYEMGFAIIGGR